MSAAEWVVPDGPPPMIFPLMPPKSLDFGEFTLPASPWRSSTRSSTALRSGHHEIHLVTRQRSDRIHPDAVARSTRPSQALADGAQVCAVVQQTIPPEGAAQVSAGLTFSPSRGWPAKSHCRE